MLDDEWNCDPAPRPGQAGRLVGEVDLRRAGGNPFDVAGGAVWVLQAEGQAAELVLPDGCDYVVASQLDDDVRSYDRGAGVPDDGWTTNVADPLPLTRAGANIAGNDVSARLVV